MIDTGDTAWVLISAAWFHYDTWSGFLLWRHGPQQERPDYDYAEFLHCRDDFRRMDHPRYAMTFGTDIGGFIGSLDKIGLAGVGLNVLENGTIPELAFVAFQCMFAVITPALITGAFAERMRFAAFAVLILLWAILIYNPMAHWVWGGGFLAQLGALDFAGGLVIHILSGVSGLTICILLGTRRGYGQFAMLPHNLPMTVLGATLLWFGWFASTPVRTRRQWPGCQCFRHDAGRSCCCHGFLVLVEWIRNGKPTILGAASGCIAGLVAITPAAGFVKPMPAVCIGLIGGVVCYLAVAVLKEKLGYDDSLDAFGVHGIGGTWGSIATGLWATTEVNPAGADGLFYGDSHLLFAQVVSVIVAYALAIIGTYILFKIVSSFMKVRTDETEEIAGLDIVEHGERGYASSMMSGSPIIASLENSSEMLANTILRTQKE